MCDILNIISSLFLSQKNGIKKMIKNLLKSVFENVSKQKVKATVYSLNNTKT